MQMAVMAISQLYSVMWSQHGLWWQQIVYDAFLAGKTA